MLMAVEVFLSRFLKVDGTMIPQVRNQTTKDMWRVFRPIWGGRNSSKCLRFPSATEALVCAEYSMRSGRTLWKTAKGMSLLGSWTILKSRPKEHCYLWIQRTSGTYYLQTFARSRVQLSPSIAGTNKCTRFSSSSSSTTFCSFQPSSNKTIGYSSHF